MSRKFIVLICLLTFSLLVNAQDELALVINIHGQVYRWSIGDSEPRSAACDLQGNRLHNWDSSLVLSPNGEWVTFMTLEETVTTPSAPADTGLLWVCNLISGQAYRLSEISQTRMVSKAVFSPDGNQIIWTEIADDMSMARLMLHDLSSQETRVLVDELPLTRYCSVSSGAPKLIWGDGGIIIPYMLTEASDPCRNDGEKGFAHYDASGILLNRFPVENTRFETFLWLVGDEPRLAYYGYRNEVHEVQLYSINIVTGEIREENAVIEAFRPNGSSGDVPYY